MYAPSWNGYSTVACLVQPRDTVSEFVVQSLNPYSREDLQSEGRPESPIKTSPVLYQSDTVALSFNKMHTLQTCVASRGVPFFSHPFRIQEERKRDKTDQYGDEDFDGIPLTLTAEREG